MKCRCEHEMTEVVRVIEERVFWCPECGALYSESEFWDDPRWWIPRIQEGAVT